MEAAADLLIHSAKLATLAGHSKRLACGEEMSEIGLILDGAVLIGADKILAVGRTEELLQHPAVGPQTQRIDAQNHLVIPGFVDPHTHALYAGSREEEFRLKLQGASYLDILQRGGGIHSTVKATTEAADEEILRQTQSRLECMLALGTTTVEIKSGYGLTVEQELRLLRLLKRLRIRKTHQTIVSTFMGAHAIPQGQTEGEYTKLILEKMLPAVCEENLADFCDVFCEKGVFGVESSLAILKRAWELGLKLKVHADELSSSGGAELAARVQAISAEHLVGVSPDGIEALSRAEVIAVLLPATSFFLAKNRYAPAQELLKSGVPLALATDCNPGSAPTESLPLVMTLACLYLHLSPEQALTAATINAAHALGLGAQVGSIEVGKQADLLILNVTNAATLPYHLGGNPVLKVIVKGQVVREN